MDASLRTTLCRLLLDTRSSLYQLGASKQPLQIIRSKICLPFCGLTQGAEVFDKYLIDWDPAVNSGKEPFREP